MWKEKEPESLQDVIYGQFYSFMDFYEISQGYTPLVRFQNLKFSFT